ncbi:UNVERIFIED_CONTAM: hypothetical protein GTU68_037732 [Idotea baltica]|nr:hypothetical protein [Idotea baltica]
MQESLKLISLSHLQAPVGIREQFHLADEPMRNMLLTLRSVLDIGEALILSTCNRTEIYYSTAEDLSEKIIKLLCLEKGVSYSPKVAEYFACNTDEQAAVEHLFRVAMGLESQVIGDLQISSQLKRAYSATAEAEMAGPFLHRALHTIFHANKRVQMETPYRDGAASVSYACAELVKDLVKSHREPSILVIGLGEMGRDVARNLAKEEHRLCLVNRTDAKAEALATEIGAEFMPFASLYDCLGDFTVIVSGVNGDAPIIHKENFKTSLGQRFMVDMCVPRSIAHDVGTLPGTVVYDIDEIRTQTEATIAKRKASIPAVEAIIADEMDGFILWRKELSISPVIQRFKEALEDIRMEEMARYLKKSTKSEAELMDKVTKGMVNKIIKLPVLELKAACQRGEEESLAGVLNDLFNLDRKRV